MSILVTGGAGFIGGHLAERLLADGHSVVTLDPLDPYYAVGIKERTLERCREVGGERFSFVDGSVTEAETVDSVIAEHDVEVIFHEAAQAGVRTSVEDPKKPHAINTTGLLNVLLAAEAYGVAKLVNASSSSVYGVPESLPYDEQHPTRPQSPYAVTKLAAEHYCNVWHNLTDVATVNLRYFTVYGPRMRPNMAISNFVSRCVNGDPPVIYGDGEQTRDFTYIDDIVDVNVALLETDKADGETLNVGSGGNITIRELAEYVIQETGADVEIEYADARAADARHTHADVSKAEAVVGYAPSVSIREGVSKFIDWYRANRAWYEPLVLAS